VWFAIGLWRIARVAFDAYPFSLNLIVVLEALLLTSVVLMTQNRWAAGIDGASGLAVNAAEQEPRRC
jgi:uncharacterized membrane protein